MKPTYIWGSGHFGVLTALDCERKGVKVSGFIDSNASQIKTRLGLPVLDFEQALLAKPHIIIAVKNKKSLEEITGTLLRAGLEEYKDFKFSGLITLAEIPSMPVSSPKKFANTTIVNKTIYESKQDFLISIIVPVFNASQWIERCFLSICKQTYRNSNLECFFIDDCSQDNSAQILRNLIEKYDGEIKFSLISQKMNCGAGESRNTGIRKSLGEYVIFVDADDEIAENSLFILAGLAEKYKNVDIVQGQAESVILKDGKIEKADYYYAVSGQMNFIEMNFPEYTNDTIWIMKKMVLGVPIPFTPWNRLIRKQFIIENNLYFSNIRSGQDLLWNFFASKNIKDIAFTANYTYLLHREHISVIALNQRTPFNRILVSEEMLKNIDIETIQETFCIVEGELNSRVIPYLENYGEEYDNLRERVQKIRNKITAFGRNEVCTI